MITEQKVYAITQGQVKGVAIVGLTPQAPMDTYEFGVGGLMNQCSKAELIQMHSVLGLMLDHSREIA